MPNNEAEVRIRTKISSIELERRWEAVRTAMREKKLDFLIVQNSVNVLSGYLRWFIDVPVFGYVVTLIFPCDDEMTTIWHGSRPPAEPSPPAWAIRGVKKRISVPTIPSLAYSSIYDAEKIVEELAPHKNCSIGLVGLGLMSAATYRYIVKHLNTARLEDATELVDNIKAIKSEEEVSLIRQSCRIQDIAFKHVLTCIKPGRREYEVRADIIHKCLELGAEETNILVGSAPTGKPARILPAYLNNRVIGDSDQFVVLIETNGPGGQWGELARTICLGKVSSELEEQFEVAKEAQEKTVGLLRQGANPAAIWDEHNKLLKEAGYPEEGRIYAHGQGYDMVERPSASSDETIAIEASMNLAVHPEVISAKAHGWLCDNYLTSETGKAERLHSTVQKIFVI